MVKLSGLIFFICFPPCSVLSFLSLFFLKHSHYFLPHLFKCTFNKYPPTTTHSNMYAHTYFFCHVRFHMVLDSHFGFFSSPVSCCSFTLTFYFLTFISVQIPSISMFPKVGDNASLWPLDGTTREVKEKKDQ